MPVPLPLRFVAGPIPGIWGFIATVADDVIYQGGEFPTESTTTYQDFTWCESGQLDRIIVGAQSANPKVSPPTPATQAVTIGQCIYTGPAEAPAGYQGFYFGPINPLAAFAGRITSDFGAHPWPDVLYKIQWYPDLVFPIASPSTDGTNLGVIFGRRYYLRRTYKPGTSEGTKFLTLEYFNALQFNIPQHQTPVTTPVEWDFLGQRGSMNCLHPTIKIDAKPSAQNAWYETGVVASNGIASDQSFPATNFEDWAKYCTYDQQKFVGIGWHRLAKWVLPPNPPSLIRSA